MAKAHLDKNVRRGLAVLALLPVLTVLYFAIVQPVSFRILSSASNVLTPSTTLPVSPVAKTVSALPPVQPLPENHLQDSLQGTSLAGTEVDRAQLQVLDGALVLNGGLLFYFDYFLSLEGEMALEEIRQLLILDAQANYPAAIAVQIIDMFRRYVDYLAEVAERERQVTSEQVLQQQLSAKAMQDEVRHRHFSNAEILALFGGYDALLAKPSQASLQQKNYAEYRQAIEQHPEHQESVATALFGAEAAQNLRNVQYQRQQWAGRMAHYEKEKQAVLEAYAQDPDGRQQALALLQQRLFSVIEVRRVQALERISRQAE